MSTDGGEWDVMDLETWTKVPADPPPEPGYDYVQEVNGALVLAEDGDTALRCYDPVQAVDQADPIDRDRE